jgi:hypothetical protein
MPAPAPSTGKPSFALPTLPVSNASNLPFPQSMSASSTSSESNGDVSILCANFKNYAQNSGPRDVLDRGVARFRATFRLLRNGANTAAPGASSSTTTASAPASKPLFPTTSAAGPPPVAFSFASSPAPAPAFSFGSNPPAPAPAPAVTTFSFASSAAPAPAPASSPKFAFTGGAPAPAPAPSGGGPEDAEEAGEKDEPTVLEEADEDWDTVHRAKFNAYHYREPKTPKKFANGELKLQQYKSDSTNRRMVARDATGKVTLNVKISTAMSFTKNILKGKASISFLGLRDAGHGPELLRLQCKVTDADALHAKLDEMTK